MIYPKGPKPRSRSSPLQPRRSRRCLATCSVQRWLKSSDPLWRHDPDFEQMTVDFRRALAKLVPLFMPELLFRLDRNRQPLFKEFAAAITPTEFVPGRVFGTGSMQPIDYFVAMAEGSDCAARQSRPCHRPATGTGEYFSVPYFSVSHAAGPRLEDKGLYRDAR